MAAEAVRIPCEGSGCPAHNPTRLSPVVTIGMCSMCGQDVACEAGCAVDHKRDDLLAMLDRGDFDA